MSDFDDQPDDFVPEGSLIARHLGWLGERQVPTCQSICVVKARLHHHSWSPYRCTAVLQADLHQRRGIYRRIVDLVRDSGLLIRSGIIGRFRFQNLAYRSNQTQRPR